MTEQDPITATVRQFCRLSGLGKTKVFSLIRDGVIASVKVGGSRLIVLDSYRRLIEAGATRKYGVEDGVAATKNHK
jgi:excisionase family DNA binding protein